MRVHLSSFGVAIAFAKMHRVNAHVTDVDYRAEEAMKQVLKPEFHNLIPAWMTSAGDNEKRGIIRLANIAEPSLYKTIGRPQTESQACRLMARPRAGFGMDYQAPPMSPPGQTGFLYTMNRAGSMPMLPGPPGFPPPGSLEDPEEIARIPKPGGTILKMTDSSTVMLMKNKQRNIGGTFKLFSGSGEYQTTSRSQFNLRSIGQENLSWKGL